MMYYVYSFLCLKALFYNISGFSMCVVKNYTLHHYIISHFYLSLYCFSPTNMCRGKYKLNYLFDGIIFFKLYSVLRSFVLFQYFQLLLCHVLFLRNQWPYQTTQSYIPFYLVCFVSYIKEKDYGRFLNLKQNRNCLPILRVHYILFRLSWQNNSSPSPPHWCHWPVRK